MMTSNKRRKSSKSISGFPGTNSNSNSIGTKFNSNKAPGDNINSNPN